MSVAISSDVEKGLGGVHMGGLRADPGRIEPEKDLLAQVIVEMGGAASAVAAAVWNFMEADARGGWQDSSQAVLSIISAITGIGMGIYNIYKFCRLQNEKRRKEKSDEIREFQQALSGEIQSLRNALIGGKYTPLPDNGQAHQGVDGELQGMPTAFQSAEV
ncbi:MAG: hypothetical protein LBT98_03795 [Puniceicoccales bacterium]|jgi:hypothetical protein|nr:hypothetical protein [Puniceicoccales bacterium]